MDCVAERGPRVFRIGYLFSLKWNYRIFTIFNAMRVFSFLINAGALFRVVLFVFLILPTVLIAQEKMERISEDPLMGKQKRDTSDVNKLFEQWSALRGVNPDSAIATAIRAIEISEEINYEKGKGQGFKNIGLVYWGQGDFKNAEDYFKRSLGVYQKISDTAGIANLQSNLGAVYLTTGDEPRALEYLVKAVRNADVVNDTLRMGSALLNMGSIYSNEPQTYNLAEENYLSALEMFGSMNSKEQFPIKMEGIAIGSANLGELFLNRGSPKRALSYLRASYEAYNQIDGNVAAPLNFLGRAYTDLDQFDLAENYHNDALAATQKQGDKFQETKAYLGLGDVFRRRNLHRQAIAFYEKGLELAQEIKVWYEQQETLKGLSESYAAIGNYQKAFEYIGQSIVVTDSLRSKEYKDVVKKLQVQFDSERKDRQIELLNAQNTINEIQIEEDARAKQLLYIIIGLFLAIITGFVFQFFYIRKTNKRLAFERSRSEQILLNILPKETADELKENGFIKAKEFEEITVLFTDFKAFSLVAERISAEMLVRSVDYYFKNFDEITERNNLEKIKTIGDAYMCAGGVPTPNSSHAQDAFEAAVEILNFVKETELNPPAGIYPFKIRIGLNSGPVVAGVVGTKKFAYDIWGNTVNIAARMESGSLQGRINVSETTYQLLKDEHKFTYRGEVEAKNGQLLKMYFADLETAEVLA